MCILTVVADVTAELQRAYTKFPSPQNGPHEGYAVLLEEVDEAWDEIKANDPVKTRKEMIQVAAMAIRFIVDADERAETQHVRVAEVTEPVRPHFFINEKGGDRCDVCFGPKSDHQG